MRLSGESQDGREAKSGRDLQSRPQHFSVSRPDGNQGRTGFAIPSATFSVSHGDVSDLSNRITGVMKGNQSVTFSDYQNKARTTAFYPDLGNNLYYPTLGLCGESGEVAEKIKKIMRDNEGAVSDQHKAEILKELGDVLWYLSNLASELDLDLADVAEQNIRKLFSRKQRGRLKGNGDNR